MHAGKAMSWNTTQQGLILPCGDVAEVIAGFDWGYVDINVADTGMSASKTLKDPGPPSLTRTT